MGGRRECCILWCLVRGEVDVRDSDGSTRGCDCCVGEWRMVFAVVVELVLSGLCLVELCFGDRLSVLSIVMGVGNLIGARYFGRWIDLCLSGSIPNS
jgi:hypothetical protein